MVLACVPIKRILPARKTLNTICAYKVRTNRHSVEATKHGLTLWLGTDIQREYVTGTAAISGFASCIFGIFTNMPVALAYAS